MNADVAARELVKELEPLKIVFLNDKSGLFHGITGTKLDVINLVRHVLSFGLLALDSFLLVGV